MHIDEATFQRLKTLVREAYSLTSGRPGEILDEILILLGEVKSDALLASEAGVDAASEGDYDEEAYQRLFGDLP